MELVALPTLPTRAVATVGAQTGCSPRVGANRAAVGEIRCARDSGRACACRINAADDRIAGLTTSYASIGPRPPKSTIDTWPGLAAAVNAAARAAFDDYAERWGERYPALIRLWDNGWEECIGVRELRGGDRPPHLLHGRDQVAERPLPAGDQGWRPFTTEQAALQCLYLVTWCLDPTGTGRTRWTMRWKPGGPAG